MIKVQNISKSFKNGFSLKDVSFNIENKDVIALVGDNGCGKTTILKCLTGEYTIKDGKITNDQGNPLSREERMKIGFFNDSNSVPLGMKVNYYLKYSAACFGIIGKEYENRLKKIVDYLNIEKYLNNLMKNLSSGWKKRVILASILVRNPNVIFFDEPTANMDVKAKIEVMELIEELSQKNDIAILITSHIIEELQQLCNKLVLVNDGKIVYNSKFDKNTENISELYLRYTTKKQLKKKVNINSIFGE